MNTYKLPCGCVVERKTEHLLSMCEDCTVFSAECHARSAAERMASREQFTTDPPGYAQRVRALEADGLTTSDAQGVADVEFNRIDLGATQEERLG